MQNRLLKIPSAFAPLLLTPLVLLVHGYHPFAGDAGIYVAGVRHILDPSLYPVNAAFPTAFTRMSIFPWILAALVRLTHLSLPWMLLAAHLASIGLFLFACRQLASRLFPGESARWCAVLFAAACFTLPVAGTALFIMDPYGTARSFSTPLGLLALTAILDRARFRAAVLLLFAALIHPLMGAYASIFVLLYALIAAKRARLAVLACCTLFAAAAAVFLLTHPSANSQSYLEALDLPQHSFLFLSRWHWYEVLGLLLPLLLYGHGLRKLRPAGPKHALCLACLCCGTTSLLVAAFFVSPAGPWTLVPIQVLRSFHLIYAAGIVLCGGILAKLLSRSRLAGVSLIALLFAGVFAAEPFAWPACNRIEWPASTPANPWQKAFLWIRFNTPRNAVFAYSPQLVYLPEEDEQGFRAIAERDHLGDDKDAGIVAVIPQLADRWALQRNAQLDANSMTDSQRIAALKPLGATWMLLPPQTGTDLPCPYRNSVVAVCRMDE
ncbi:MAG TPA: hypothetical protein VHE33_04140 [Acidobacteriaceae bacterium]|nr:hypothetical protein [Acidobacteriaceae bacterium]